MQTVKIETTQNVVLSYEIASLGDRILAYLIDSLIIVAYVIVVMLVGSLLISELQDDRFIWVWLIFYLPIFFYHLLFEIFRDGQSPGKQQMKIKVVKLNGSEPSIGAYLLRWILRPIDNGFYGIVAILCITAGGKGQRLGDIAAGTSVIKLRGSVDNPKQQIIKKLKEEYQPVYPEAEQLSERDIDIILQALKHYRETKNLQPVTAIFLKIKDLLRIQTDLDAVSFLEVIVKDYNHFATHG
jgi:uncharacterized RDD family membrane protein YckC